MIMLGSLTRLPVWGYWATTKRSPLCLCVHPLSEQLMLGARLARERCCPWSSVDCLQCVLEWGLQEGSVSGKHCL